MSLAVVNAGFAAYSALASDGEAGGEKHEDKDEGKSDEEGEKGKVHNPTDKHDDERQLQHSSQELEKSLTTPENHDPAMAETSSTEHHGKAQPSQELENVLTAPESHDPAMAEASSTEHDGKTQHVSTGSDAIATVKQETARRDNCDSQSQGATPTRDRFNSAHSGRLSDRMAKKKSRRSGSPTIEPKPCEPAQTTQASAGDELLDKYTLGEEIGSGAFGVVYACTKKNTNEMFAVKMIDMVEAPLEFIKREAALLAKLRHPCVVRLHDVYYEKVFVCIVMDIIRGGDMIDGLQRHLQSKGMIPVNVLQNVCKQMAQGISWLHQNDVVHRDVKGDNFLTDSKDIAHPRCRIYITDFGTACSCRDDTRLHDQCGTKTYWAPEFYRLDYSKKVDIWAIAVVMFGMLTGRYPFRDGKEVKNKKPIVSSRCGKHVKECVLQMLEKEEKKRLDAKGVLGSPFFMSAPSAATADIEAATADAEALETPNDVETNTKDSCHNVAVNERRRELRERMERSRKSLSRLKPTQKHDFLPAAFEVIVDTRGRKNEFAWWDEAKAESSGLLHFKNAKPVTNVETEEDAESSLDNVRLMLENHNIKTERFGRNTKSLRKLMAEIQNGESSLMLDATKHKCVVRLVEVTLVRLVAIVKGERHILLQVAKEGEDGSSKPGNGNQLPGKKKKPYESGRNVVERILRDRLKLDDFRSSIEMNFDSREYFEEEDESVSYPGLRTVYRKEIFEGLVTSADKQFVKQLAKPETRSSGSWFAGFSSGSKTRSYGWFSEAGCEALSATVRAAFGEAEHVSALVNAPVGYTYDELVKVLQDAHFDISRFGQGTTKSLQEFSDEMRAGKSALVRRQDGTLIREVDLVVLKLSRSDGSILVEQPGGRLPAVKRRVDENQFAAARRLLRRDLRMEDNFVNISPSDVTLVEEETISSAYECLTTLYRKRIVSAAMVDDAA
eukprot:TRINITY_DN18824_c1_g1_i1.p1 TRINITY_DN18824_c1_g1~~TRINITY_DN18824_c1_g1_i1.p1  ORF type:complete len:1109 (-),score=202.24 TRINITY_DN18824_c1_g1_i1:36-2894(-)